VFPRDIVCLRNISINTLHKGNDDDDDNNNNNPIEFFITNALGQEPKGQLQTAQFLFKGKAEEMSKFKQINYKCYT